jgi:hypothetical protein
VEIGTEAAQFPEKEYINGIFLAVTGTCPALRPWYIEQEFCVGLPHICKSAFSCGYILRGVEKLPKHAVLPAASEANDESAESDLKSRINTTSEFKTT